MELLDTASGNAVVVALDHGLSLGAVEGFTDPEATLRDVLSADPDGVLVGPHFARRFSETLNGHDVDVIVTGDIVTDSTRPGYDDRTEVWEPAFDADLLLDLDPAGVKVVLVFGRDDKETFRRNVAHVPALAEELRGTDIPLVVEPVMWGTRIDGRFETDPEYVSRACRMAWEYGADVLKAPYTGDPETFGPIVDHAPVPAMILGGPASGTTRAMLADVAGAMNAGARGVMIGRSVWKSEDTCETVSALNRIVHDGASVAEVWDR